MTKVERNEAIARMQGARTGKKLARYEVRAVNGGWTYSGSGGVIFADRASAETDASFCRDWEER